MCAPVWLFTKYDMALLKYLRRVDQLPMPMKCTVSELTQVKPKFNIVHLVMTKPVYIMCLPAKINTHENKKVTSFSDIHENLYPQKLLFLWYH